MDNFMLLSASTLFFFALVFLFGRDMLWKWHVATKKVEGVPLHILVRTPEWDRRRKYVGIFLAITAVLGYILAFSGG